MRRSSDPRVAADALIDAYLADVEAELADVEPAERAAVLAGLREHIEDALRRLGRAAGRADVERVLADLGPAADLRAAVDVPSGVPSQRGRPTPASVATLVLAVLSVLLVIVNVLVAAAAGLLALIIGLVAARSANAASRGLFGLAAAVGGAGLVLALLYAMVLLRASDGPLDIEPPVQAPAPTAGR